MKTALITGVTGQDGTLLTELLLARGYRVVGTTRNAATARESARASATAPLASVSLEEVGEGDHEALHRLVASVAPDEIYNLAGQTRVTASWADPVGTAQSTGLAVAHLLEAVRHGAPRARFFQASSSEMFDPLVAGSCDENTPLRPASPYGAAKLFAHALTGAYRETFGIYAVSGILFNHESPRRSPEFVTRKITQAVVRIARGEQAELLLGNLEAKRDWSYAGDIVRGMWLMLQQDSPADYVLGSGTAHSVAEFCEAAFSAVGLDWRTHVRSDPALLRPGEAAERRADPSRARTRLGWTPEVDFRRLVRMMVEAELSALPPPPSSVHPSR